MNSTSTSTITTAPPITTHNIENVDRLPRITNNVTKGQHK